MNNIPQVPQIPPVPQVLEAPTTPTIPTTQISQDTQASQTGQTGQTDQVQNTSKIPDPTIPIEEIMKASFGEVGEDVRTSFKKTVLIKQYETEVIEAESTLHFDKQLTAAERMFICAALQVQMEYTAYCQLAYKGMVTNTELRQHKWELEAGLAAIKNKAEQALGRSLDNYIKTELEE